MLSASPFVTWKLSGRMDLLYGPVLQYKIAAAHEGHQSWLVPIRRHKSQLELGSSGCCTDVHLTCKTTSSLFAYLGYLGTNVTQCAMLAGHVITRCW